MPQLKNISIYRHWITCIGPSLARSYSSFQPPYFVAVFLLLRSTFLCSHRGIVVGKDRLHALLHCLNGVFYLPSCALIHVPLPLHKQLQDFPFVFHGIYTTSPRVINCKRHKVMVISNRCHLYRSPDICVNIIQNPLGAMICSAKSHFGLLFDDAMFTKF